MDWTIFLPDIEAKKQEYLDSLKVTPEDVKKIMDEPQRTDLWKKYRTGRMTASNYGSAVGHNKYASPRALLKNLLWDDFKGNAATEHGTKNEPIAANIYELFMKQVYKWPDDNPLKQQLVPALDQNNKIVRQEFYYPGLIVCLKYPWLAVSPDGLPCVNNVRFLLEIKCPFNSKLYSHIPHYYYDQIQGIMGILKLPFCDFVVWTYNVTQIRRVAFDPQYWRQVLFPGLSEFYLNEYLPRLILKKHGFLKTGQLEPQLTLLTQNGEHGNDNHHTTENNSHYMDEFNVNANNNNKRENDPMKLFQVKPNSLK